VRFGRVRQESGHIPVVQVGTTMFDLRPLASDIDGIFLSGSGMARTTDWIAEGRLRPLRDGSLTPNGAPIARPGKIVCIGLNYLDHAAETSAPIPTEPIVFMKDPSTIIGPFDDVHLPRGSKKTDWEVELGVVIGSTARYLESTDDALDYVAGYVLSNDVSEREFQLERGGQWDKGKSCETFNPLGPWLVPSRDIDDPQNLQLILTVNGDVRQDSSTSQMIFPVSYIVWYLSQFMVLYPGDLVNTGTPAGVALGTNDFPYLTEGDVMELSISGLGRARQKVVAR